MHIFASVGRQYFPAAEPTVSCCNARAPEIVLETRNSLRTHLPVTADLSSNDGSTFFPETSHLSKMPGQTILPVTSHFSLSSTNSGCPVSAHWTNSSR